MTNDNDISNSVLLSTLAAEMGMDRSHARRFINRLGIEWLRVRGVATQGQLALAVSSRDAQYILETRQSHGFSLPGDGVQRIVSSDREGYFYVVQLIPELEPTRCKFGFATNVDSRLSAHRTTCPFAVVLQSWPCRAGWEITAIACATKENCISLSNEVYTCTDIASVLARLTAFFEVLPLPKYISDARDQTRSGAVRRAKAR